MNNKKTFIFSVFLAALMGAAIALGGYEYFFQKNSDFKNFDTQQKNNVRLSSYISDSNFVVPEGLNFITAAKLVTPAVVHIKAKVEAEPSGQSYSSPLDDFFRQWLGDQYPQHQAPQREAMASGSGVIISPDGYIVTNNHVVENAEDLTVVLSDNREYSAEVIGTDPNTDLALIKIDEKGLNFVKFGNSDDVQVGQWVLAVGNPFNLTSTVTAGIVSAKARNINILHDRRGMQIESYIQTDAAVNPGNSGGALVNLKGELVGINSAIATPTGSFAGYSFAVPSSLVKKVVDDLRKYGVVQRAMLGIQIQDLDDPRLHDQDLPTHRGAYVAGVGDNSAADEAGLAPGDIITAIDGKDVKNVAALQELVARHRPGDKIEVTYIHDGDKKTASTTLKNTMGDTKLLAKNDKKVISGAALQEVPAAVKEKLNIDGGVQLTQINAGKFKDAGIREGFIITSVDKQPINNVEDLQAILQNKQGGTLIEGIYPNGERAYYGMGW